MRDRYGVPFWKAVFYLLTAVGFVVLVRRYAYGLGAVTNLSDAYPWGLWIGFDVLCGVGLAAGGFTITTVVYVFNAKRFKPIVRPTILTAFLGYVLVIVALLADLGRPWNLWRPIVLWNPRSVMFEVAWCVMLYTTVLALEFSSLLLEKLRWTRALAVQQAVTLPLVVAGALLSTLHQSSLGSLYLIVPGKLHPLWYTPLLPVLFFLSAIAVGLAMVIVESRLSSRAFGRALEMPLVSEVGRVLVAALGVYAVTRVFDLADRGVLGAAFRPTGEAGLFWLEFLGGVLLPMGRLAAPRVRANTGALYGAALLTVMGFVVHRLNVSITGFESAQGGRYVPAWSELAITLMLVALGFGVFALAVRHLRVYPEAAPARA
ncbi:MAG: Ni/Fe-hydrogenase cytochrome b subunit [Acidobacteria bacterium]|nr:Ni/Fe-hydrogenase cytochrome b subunit [Acidobacteriota bacterium]